MTARVAMLTLSAFAMWRLKRFYADARVDDLQWILGPTTQAVTALTSARFEWQSGEGYLSRERLFLIEKACAGINFLIAAFGMLAWVLRGRVNSLRSAGGVILASAAASYSAAVLVNAMRITVAMWLAARPFRIHGVTAAQAHRVEGVIFYFGGLLLLCELAQRVAVAPSFRRLSTPLCWYYAIAIGVPLANGAAANSGAFIEHTLFVVIVSLVCVFVYAFCCSQACPNPGRSSRVFLSPRRPSPPAARPA